MIQLQVTQVLANVMRLGMCFTEALLSTLNFVRLCWRPAFRGSGTAC